MTWVIGPLCIDKLDTACVGVCPVDCIHLYKGDEPNIPKNQLLIDPSECIDCAACEPACPWEAIYQDEAVPQEFKERSMPVFRDRPTLNRRLTKKNLHRRQQKFPKTERDGWRNIAEVRDASKRLWEPRTRRKDVPSPSRLVWSLEYVFLNAINCCWLARKSGPISLFE